MSLRVVVILMERERRRLGRERWKRLVVFVLFCFVLFCLFFCFVLFCFLFFFFLSFLFLFLFLSFFFSFFFFFLFFFLSLFFFFLFLFLFISSTSFSFHTSSPPPLLPSSQIFFNQVRPLPWVLIEEAKESPQKYLDLCWNWCQYGKCYKKNCSFPHGEEEKRVWEEGMREVWEGERRRGREEWERKEEERKRREREEFEREQREVFEAGRREMERLERERVEAERRERERLEQEKRKKEKEEQERRERERIEQKRRERERQEEERRKRERQEEEKRKREKQEEERRYREKQQQEKEEQERRKKQRQQQEQQLQERQEQQRRYQEIQEQQKRYQELQQQQQNRHKNQPQILDFTPILRPQLPKNPLLECFPFFVYLPNNKVLESPSYALHSGFLTLEKYQHLIRSTITNKIKVKLSSNTALEYKSTMKSLLILHELAATIEPYMLASVNLKNFQQKMFVQDEHAIYSPPTKDHVFLQGEIHSFFHQSLIGSPFDLSPLLALSRDDTCLLDFPHSRSRIFAKFFSSTSETVILTVKKSSLTSLPENPKSTAYFMPSDRTRFEFMYKAIEKAASLPHFLHPEIPWKGGVLKWTKNPSLRESLSRVLSLEQFQAMESLLSDNRGIPTIIQGCFGSGKSTSLALTIAHIVDFVNKNPVPSGKIRVLITSRNNSTADNYLRLFCEHPRMMSMNLTAVRFLSKFSKSKSLLPEKYEPFIIRSGNEFPSDIHINIITTTFVAAAELPFSSFDFVCCDEAAQSPEHEVIMAASLVHPTRGKLVLLGDPQQSRWPFDLPTPLVRRGIVEQETIMTRLKNKLRGYLPNPKLLGAYCFDLIEVYRCPSEIVLFCSAHFYPSVHLVPKKDEGLDDLYWPSLTSTPTFPSFPMGWLYVSGRDEYLEEQEYGSNAFHSRNSRNILGENEDEAIAIAGEVQRMLMGVKDEEEMIKRLVVVSWSFNQVRLIRDTLKKHGGGLNRVTVITSDSVQGNEYDVVIFSPVLSHNWAKKGLKPPQNSILKAPALVNTMLTRTMARFLVVGNPVPLASICDDVWISYVTHCQENGTLLDEGREPITYSEIKHENIKMRESAPPDETPEVLPEDPSPVPSPILMTASVPSQVPSASPILIPPLVPPITPSPVPLIPAARRALPIKAPGAPSPAPSSIPSPTAAPSGLSIEGLEMSISQLYHKSVEIFGKEEAPGALNFLLQTFFEKNNLSTKESSFGSRAHEKPFANTLEKKGSLKNTTDVEGILWVHSRGQAVVLGKDKKGHWAKFQVKSRKLALPGEIVRVVTDDSRQWADVSCLISTWGPSHRILCTFEAALEAHARQVKLLPVCPLVQRLLSNLYFDTKQRVLEIGRKKLRGLVSHRPLISVKIGRVQGGWREHHIEQIVEFEDQTMADLMEAVVPRAVYLRAWDPDRFEVLWKSRKGDFPHGFSQKLPEKDIPRQTPFAWEQVVQRNGGRRSYTLTIDPEGSRDRDDALSGVFVPGKGGGDGGYYLVAVHIADVSLLVERGSDIDVLAAEKNQSRYCPAGEKGGRKEVHHMLPRECVEKMSLEEQKLRSALSVVMRIDGNTGYASLVPGGILRSSVVVDKNLSYLEADRLLDGQETKRRVEQETLSTLLQAASVAQRSLPSDLFQSSSPDYDFEYEGRTVRIKDIRRQDTISHQIVDTFMVLANKIVADSLLKELKGGASKIPGVPLLCDCDGKGVSMVFYSDRSSAVPQHPKMGFPYTHFTSPLRRYSDLFVHRLVGCAIGSNSPSSCPSLIDIEELIHICNENTRLVRQYESRILDLFFSTYLLQDQRIFETEVQDTTRISMQLLGPGLPRNCPQVNVDAKSLSPSPSLSSSLSLSSAPSSSMDISLTEWIWNGAANKDDWAPKKTTKKISFSPGSRVGVQLFPVFDSSGFCLSRSNPFRPRLIIAQEEGRSPTLLRCHSNAMSFAGPHLTPILEEKKREYKDLAQYVSVMEGLVAHEAAFSALDRSGESLKRDERGIGKMDLLFGEEEIEPHHLRVLENVGVVFFSRGDDLFGKEGEAPIVKGEGNTMLVKKCLAQKEQEIDHEYNGLSLFFGLITPFPRRLACPHALISCQNEDKIYDGRLLCTFSSGNDLVGVVSFLVSEHNPYKPSLVLPPYSPCTHFRKHLKQRNSRVEVILLSPPHTAMLNTLQNLVPDSLPGKIAIGKGAFWKESEDISSKYEVIRQVGGGQLNKGQKEAFIHAFKYPFTVIQGPPGTGKTRTAVEIIAGYVKLNLGQFCMAVMAHTSLALSLLSPSSSSFSSSSSSPKVLVCGPSNQSANVLANELLLKNVNFVRTFSSHFEKEDLERAEEERRSGKKRDLPMEESLYQRCLHVLIRKENPEIVKTENEIRIREGRGETKALKKRLSKLIEQEEIRQLQLTDCVVSTLAVAGRRLVSYPDITFAQVVVDECSQALDSEAMMGVGLATERVVLLGDHKQLSPVVTSTVQSVRDSLSVSLLERYGREYGQSSAFVVLRSQYRMHESIVKFPSKQFYHNELETDNSVKMRKSKSPCRAIWSDSNRVCFRNCYVEGGGESRFCDQFSSSPGANKNENGNDLSELTEEELGMVEADALSYFNKREAIMVAEDVRKMMDEHIRARDIIIITPYRAQVRVIEEQLSKMSQQMQGEKKKKKDVPQVLSVHSAQGTEAKIVLISTVRSVRDLEEVGGLGHLDDDRLFNVALTRAREGLIVYGCEKTMKMKYRDRENPARAYFLDEVFGV